MAGIDPATFEVVILSLEGAEMTTEGRTAGEMIGGEMVTGEMSGEEPGGEVEMTGEEEEEDALALALALALVREDVVGVAAAGARGARARALLAGVAGLDLRPLARPVAPGLFNNTQLRCSLINQIVFG